MSNMTHQTRTDRLVMLKIINLFIMIMHIQPVHLFTAW